MTTNEDDDASTPSNRPVSRFLAADLSSLAAQPGCRQPSGATLAHSQEFGHLDDVQLLAHLSRLNGELRCRGIVRTSNGIVADWPEKLAARYFGVELEPNSKMHYDLITKNGSRVQVKGRGLKQFGGRVGAWSAMHGLMAHGFDEVVAVVLNPDYSVAVAYRLSWEAARRYAKKDTQGEYVLSCTVALRADPQVVAFDITTPSCDANGK